MIQGFKSLDLSQLIKMANSLAKAADKKPLTIGLIGDLGTGKTTFIKHFARALGISRVKSPTFIIIDVKQQTARNFYHIDLYRLNKGRELKPLGIMELLKKKQDLILIEWVDKFPFLKQYCDIILQLNFTKNPAHRNVTIEIR